MQHQQLAQQLQLVFQQIALHQQLAMFTSVLTELQELEQLL